MLAASSVAITVKRFNCLLFEDNNIFIIVTIAKGVK